MTGFTLKLHRILPYVMDEIIAEGAPQSMSELVAFGRTSLRGVRFILTPHSAKAIHLGPEEEVGTLAFTEPRRKGRRAWFCHAFQQLFRRIRDMTHSPIKPSNKPTKRSALKKVGTKNSARRLGGVRRLAEAECESIGSCERCGTTEGLTPHHIEKRRLQETVALVANLICLCLPCHRWVDTHPALADEWIESKWPGRMEKLHAVVWRL